MEESPRKSQFLDSASQKSAMTRMNEWLWVAEKELQIDVSQIDYPLVFIIGAPRSGTTLMSQLLAQSGQFAWVSNFVARFWLAPAIGAAIWDGLGLRAETYTSSFKSTHGVTDGWLEPHEFGYFWDRFFDIGQPTHNLSNELLKSVDGDCLLHALNQLQAVFGRATVLKNNTWCTLQAAFLSRLIPRAKFVVCRRDNIFLAQSLLFARRTRLVDEEKWWSVRPSSYAKIAERSIFEQVAHQARDIQAEMDMELSQISPDRVINITYEQLCADPYGEILRICSNVGTDNPLASNLPPSFQSTDKIRLNAREWKKLEAAMNQIEPGRVNGNE